MMRDGVLGGQWERPLSARKDGAANKSTQSKLAETQGKCLLLTPPPRDSVGKL